MRHNAIYVWKILTSIANDVGHIRFSQVQPVKVNLISKGSLLNASFYPCSGAQPGPVIMLLHGWPGNQDNPLSLAPKICAGGINVLVFNFRGTWGSQGYFSNPNAMEDIGEAIRFLKSKNTMVQYAIDTSQIIVAGYSLGGGMMFTEAINNWEIKKIISIASADMSVFIKMLVSDPQYRKNSEDRIRTQSQQGGFAKVEGDIATANDELIKNIDRYDLVKNAESLRDRKILFIVGWDDTTSKMEDNALPLYRKLKQLKASSVSIAAFSDNHSFSGVRDQLAQTIVNWVKENR